MITIGYSILFTINVLHDYYDDKLSRETVIVPTDVTIQTLKNYQMIFKASVNGGLILARITDPEGTLQVPITDTDNFKLAFYLKPSSPYFYNRTNLSINPTKTTNLIPNRRGFYFSNLEKAAGNKFEVNGFQKPNGDTDLKHLSRTANTEVSTTDELIFMPTIFRVKFDSPTNSFSINIKDRADADVVATTTITETDNFNEYEVKLAKNLKADFYKISIDGGAPQNVYLSNQVFHDKPFGVIEIFHPSNFEEFNFLKTEGAVPDQKIQVKGEADYFLWFKNRKAKWRFVYQGDLPTSIEVPNLSDNNGPSPLFEFENDNTNYFESFEPIDIRESYLITKNDNDRNLPNPDGKILKVDTDTNDIYAEVYI